MKNLKQYLTRITPRRTSEQGNMFIFIFGMIMIMILVVGLAIDTAGTVAARQGTQNTLTTATVAAASQLNSQGNINTAQAREVAYSMYGNNRLNTSMLRCSTHADANKVGGTLKTFQGCGFVVTDFTVKDSGRRGTPEVSMTTYECSPNTFLSVAVEETCFHINSVGRIASSKG